jgi:NADH-quinone oxidoreductase subunit M
VPTVLLQILLTPVLASLVIFLTRRRIGQVAGWIAALALFYTTCLAVLVTVEVYRGDLVFEQYLVIAPGIGLQLLADGLSAPTLAVILLLCTALAVYSIRYVEHRIEILYHSESTHAQAGYVTRFFTLLPFFPVGFIGTILSTNLVAVYFFMEVLTIALFFLMAFFGYRERVRVAFVSLSWGIIGALLFLVGSLLVYSQIDSFEIADLHEMAGTPLLTGAIVLFVISLMMKLAVVPFHVWMPSVHAEHPTCIAGLLAVYANLAVYILIRVVVLPLGDDFARFGPPLMVLALVTMIYGSLLTLAQTDIKRLAACSTISQIAYSVLGLAALTIVSVEGSMFFFLSHIMGKTVFFSTAGIVVYVTGIRDMDKLGGLAKKMPVTAALWLIGCMMLSGFPPFSSFTAEWIMFTGIFERGVHGGPLGLAVAIGGVTAIVLTVAYTFGAARRIFFGPLSPELADTDLRDPPWTMTVPLLIIAAVSVVLGLYPGPMMDLLHTVIGTL